jgi:phage terminase large subunit-like protein
MLVSRDPHPTRKKTHVLVRRLRVWTPPEGGKIDLETTVSATIQEWRKLYNIKELVYDEFQLHHLMTEWRKKQVLKMYSFSQMSERLKADKQIVDMVVAKRIGHDGNPVLRKHVDNAQAKAQENKLRFVAPDTTQKSGYGRRLARPIDALITLSMGTDRCLYLNLA